MAKLKDVAQLAGVSVSTVSRVLNRAPGVERIPARCIDVVEAAAKSLGYRGSHLARSFQTGRSGAIGVALWNDFSSEPIPLFAAAYFAAMFVAANHAGHHLVAIGPSHEQSAASTGVMFLKEQRIDGLVTPMFGPSDDLRLLESAEAPVVIVGDGGASSIPAVELDHAAGVALAVSHLAELGHTSAAWVGPPVASAAGAREGAFHATARERGMRTEIIAVKSHWNAEDVIADVRALVASSLRRSPRISALVCYNDVTALGAIHGAKDAGLRVPEDVSVTGFDDLYGQVAVPTLTTVSHMVNEMSVAAIELLLEMLNTPGARERLSGQRRTIAPRLVVRESTARPKSDE